MVFNGPTVSIIIFLVLWLGVISILVYRMTGHYNNLTRGISRLGLKDVLENLLKEQAVVKTRQAETEGKIREIADLINTHIQKIGIVRFNPFSDTGGSQSFSLVLMDGHNNGIVMTSLYARTGNRWYVKEIREGKGVDLELSKEEISAIRRAQVTREKQKS